MKDKKATIKDVAKEAGVSISVVSYILNNTPGQSFPVETRKRIFNAAKKLNYTPNFIARGMRSRKSMNIGMVLYWDISDTIFNEILMGVSKITEQFGYNIVLCLPSNDRFKYVEIFKQRQIDGIIFVSPFRDESGFDEAEHMKLIKSEKISAVIMNGKTNEESLNYINIDFYNSSYLAVKYLQELGHRRIGYLMPDIEESTPFQMHERLYGFKDTISASKDAEGMMIHTENLKETAQNIKNGCGPTAVVLNKINYAKNFYKQMQLSGVKIPEDVSVIAASDNRYADYLVPSLTTVKIPLMDMGEMAAKVLFDLLNDTDYKVKLKLTNTIVERESCKKK